MVAMNPSSETTHQDNSATNAIERMDDQSILSRRLWLSVLIVLCCFCFLIVDVMTPQSFSGPFPAMVFTNLVTAQLTVICIWGTLVRGTFWIRLPWTLLLLVLSWCALAWGIQIEEGRPHTDSMLGVGLVWFFGFVASFVPLKIAAACFRWQIVTVSSNAAQDWKSYAIRDIMIGTLLLAVAMAFGRSMLPPDPINFNAVWRSSGLDRAEPMFAISLFGVISLLVKLPCIWIALAAGTTKIARYVAIWSVYCVALTVVEYLLLMSVLGHPGNDMWEFFFGILVGHQLMGAIILAICLPLRGLGYRLERSIDQIDSPTPATIVSA